MKKRNRQKKARKKRNRHKKKKARRMKDGTIHILSTTFPNAAQRGRSI
jgi:hypothetical protein